MLDGAAEQLEIATRTGTDSLTGLEITFFEIRHRHGPFWRRQEAEDILARIARRDADLKAWPWRAVIGAVVLVALVGWYSYNTGRKNPTVYPANCDTIAIGHEIGHPEREAPGEGAICRGREGTQSPYAYACESRLLHDSRLARTCSGSINTQRAAEDILSSACLAWELGNRRLLDDLALEKDVDLNGLCKEPGQ